MHNGHMAQDHDVARFDTWSGHYDQSILQRFFFGPVQEAAITEAVLQQYEITHVLDVGCGTGQLLRRIARRFPDAELVGVDPAPGMVHQAQAATPPNRHLEFINAGAENLPLPDDHFDLVMTTLSFHHWADQQQALYEIRRVLRSSGLFVLTDVVAAGWLRRILTRRPVTGRFHSPEAIDAMLDKGGLRTVRRTSVPWRPQVKITLVRAVG